MIVEQKSNRIASDCTWQRNTDHTLLPIVQQTNEQNGVRHKHKWLLRHNEISNAFNKDWWHIFFRINFGVSTPRKLGMWRVWFHHCMETVCNEDVVEWPGPRELWVPRFKFWVGLILTFSKESGQPFQCSKHFCKVKKLSHWGADQRDQDCPSIVPSCFGYHQLIWLMLPVLWQKVQCPCLCLFLCLLHWDVGLPTHVTCAFFPLSNPIPETVEPHFSLCPGFKHTTFNFHCHCSVVQTWNCNTCCHHVTPWKSHCTGVLIPWIPCCYVGREWCHLFVNACQKGVGGPLAYFVDCLHITPS